MKEQIIILFVLIRVSIIQSQTPYDPWKLSRITAKTNGDDCESRVRVVDEKSSINCAFSGYDVFYPVIIENFNFKEDLPNNWRFDWYGTLDDQESGSCNGGAWAGPNLESYLNGNIEVVNGVLNLKLKKEYRYNKSAAGCNPKNYRFTSAPLLSSFYIQNGIVISKLLLPENPNLWPAYWLYNDNGTNHEIDIFEFYDHDWSNSIPGVCDAYSDMRMTLHGTYNNKHCYRGRKFPVSSNFFDNWHTFQSNFSNYEVDTYVDGSLKGYATKYYEGPYHFNLFGACHYHGDSGIPTDMYSCNNVKNLEECSVAFFGNPNLGCLVWNKVDKDLSFINNNTFSVRFTFELINKVYTGGVNPEVQLFNSWNNFNDKDKQFSIDYTIIYQPIKCNVDYTVLNESQFKSYSKKTNFLTGRKIEIGHMGWSTLYINESPKATNSWHEFPTHILATDEIAFLSETIFEEGTFLRAEIIDCSTGIGVGGMSQRILSNGDTLPIVLPIDYFERDSLATYPYPTENEPLVSATDNGALQLFPNPATQQFFITVNEEDWYDLSKIEMVNALGQVFELPKESIQNISGFTEGIYFIKFYFNSGTIVVKSLIIQKE